MVEYDFDEKPSSSSDSSNKIPLLTTISRVVTLASLLISTLVVYNNEVTSDNNGINVIYNYTSFDSYRYVFAIMIAGICYVVLLIPFAGYNLVAKKQLINHHMFQLFQVIGDKVIFGLLATAAGASLGATVELQKVTFQDGLGAKMHSYLALMYIPNAFLVVSLAASLISSILSSMSLNKS